MLYELVDVEFSIPVNLQPVKLVVDILLKPKIPPVDEYNLNYISKLEFMNDVFYPLT